MTNSTPPKRTFRTLFLSDLHLGKRHAQAEALLDFLEAHRADRIYLVGDIVDLAHLAAKPRRLRQWPLTHSRVIQELAARAQAGVKVTYLPGNHDDILRAQGNLGYGAVGFAHEAVHEGADGCRYLVVHGDCFDVVLEHAGWLSGLGDIAYDFLLDLTNLLSRLLRPLGIRHTPSPSIWGKRLVKRSVNHAGRFEERVSQELSTRELDGIVCGHVHEAAIGTIGGHSYVNCGDWVESCTAVVEHHSGRFELITWPKGRTRGTHSNVPRGILAAERAKP